RGSLSTAFHASRIPPPASRISGSQILAAPTSIHSVSSFETRLAVAIPLNHSSRTRSAESCANPCTFAFAASRVRGWIRNSNRALEQAAHLVGRRRRRQVEVVILDLQQVVADRPPDAPGLVARAFQLFRDPQHRVGDRQPGGEVHARPYPSRITAAAATPALCVRLTRRCVTPRKIGRAPGRESESPQSG